MKTDTEQKKMKQILYVSTMKEAISMAFQLSKNYAVSIAENEYDSDKESNGVIIYVK